MKCLSDEILNVALLETMPMIDAAFKFNKIICNTQNLMDSFNEYEEWNELLLDFVNSKLNIRFEKTIFDKYSEEQQRLFFRKTAMCNKLKDEHYRNILSVIGRELTSLPDKDIDESKINILIKTRSVSSEFSVDVLKSLRERYPNQVNIYILEYIDSYIQEFTDINVYNEEEALQVLDENITIEDAISIVDCFKTNISIQNKAYSAKLQGHILKNRFDEDDLEYIVSNYSDFSKEVQKIIENISIDLREGELVCILGSSGVGKTTLFNVISGLIAPTCGTVFLNGENIVKKSGKISYMLQKDLLLPFKTIIDNVSLPLVIKGEKKSIAREKAQKYFAEFGLAGTEKKYPSQLSGGMRQRAALLRTYMFSCEVALLDEPFSALDAITKRKMQNWYLNIMEKIKLSTLFITHDIDEAILISKRIYIIYGSPGKIIKELKIELSEGENSEDVTLTKKFIEYKREILKLL